MNPTIFNYTESILTRHECQYMKTVELQKPIRKSLYLKPTLKLRAHVK